MEDNFSRRPILLTGASGYVGGRLLRRLEARALPVRCLVRQPERFAGRIAATTQIATGDALDAGSLASALRGAGAAYYLIHSMGAKGEFQDLDRKAASNFAEAAGSAGIERIIYLGGLGQSETGLSSHLRSRQEVGEILRESGVPVLELRASIVIGSGSLSYEMIRALTERLPVMVTPRWVSVTAQPIGIEDLLECLVRSLDLPLESSRIVEIGGADRVSYGDLMREYARQRGLRRLMIPVPVLSPRLSSLWLGLVTPLYARIGRKLVESLRHPTVAGGEEAFRLFGVRPAGVREAIARALKNEDEEFAATRWSDALSSAGPARSWAGKRFGNRIVDSRAMRVEVPAAELFRAVEGIGGARGYYADWLWKVRGFLDLLAGGVGVRRGRRDPDRLEVGDTLDWWRVEAIERPRRLRLAAEMKLPGRAWLEFEVEDRGTASEIRQTAIFDPVGLPGLLYWYGVYPIHAMIFRGMVRTIARRAET